MATAVTGRDPDLVYHSFPIEKFDTDPETGTLYVYGKATSPDVDSDEQIVDPDWSAKAMETWFASGPNVRVMHNPTAMPAGSGVKVEINRDGDGAHWVKAAVDEPTAKRMVERKHLRAFSVGIARPLIVQDVTGKARNGIIKGGELAEISLVDRPANRSCYVEIAKSAGDGSCEFTGKVFGGDDFLAKTVNVDVPKGAPVTFSPEDLKKLLEHRRLAEERESAEKGELSAADRSRLPASSFAYVDSDGNGHLPVHDEGHVRSALGRFGQQQFEDGASRKKAARKIIGRAREMGISVDEDSDVAQAAAGKTALPDGVKAAGKCGLCHGSGKIMDGNRDCPRCHGDGNIAEGEPDEHGENQDKDAEPDIAKAGARSCKGCGKSHHADSPAKFCDSCGTKLPAAGGKDAEPDVVKDSGGTGEDGPDDAGQGGGDDGGGDDPDAAAAEKAAAPAVTGKPKVPCPSCGRQVKAKMAFCPKCGGGMTAGKAGKPTPGDGVTGEHVQPVPAHREPDGPYIESLEHDAGLPTDPDGPYLNRGGAEKAAALRFKSLGVPHGLGVLHDLTCPAYAPAAVAKAHPGAALADIDAEEWMGKALDAAATAPLPEAGAMQLLWQHALTLKGADPEIVSEVSGALHKAFADANPGPGTFPVPGELSAQRFRRPYITEGHAAPSPGQDGPNTAQVPPPGGISATQFNRDYLSDGHAADSPQNKADGGAPPKPGASNGGRVFYRNTARDNTRAAMQAMHDHIAATFPDLCAMNPGPEADPAPQPGPLPRPAGSSKAAKAEKPAKRRDPEPAAARQPEPAAKAAGAASPDLVKAAVAEAAAGLAGQLAETRQLLEAQAEVLKKQAAVLDAIAGQPDPASPYRGAALPYQGKTATAPAGPLSMAGAAEQAQAHVYAELYREWRESPDPAARLAAERAMEKMRGLPYTS